MKRHILILAGDSETNQRLARVFEAAGVADISIVSSMRDACLVLTSRYCHLALVPQAKAAHQVRTLRAIKPELPIILISDESATPIPEDTLDNTLGVYSEAQLGASLPKLLQAVWTQDPSRRPNPREHDETARPGRSIAEALHAACGEIDWREGMTQVVIAVQGRPMAFCGHDEEMAKLVASEAWQGMARGNRTPHVQYRRLGKPPRAVMLYTRPFNEGLLTVVAGLHTPVYVIRQWAQRLVRLLAEQSTNYRPIHLADPDAERDWVQEGDEHTFTLAWRPVERLPEELQGYVYRRIQEVARENLCILSFLSVEETLIHLVLTCPPGRNSAWAAKLLKESTERAVRIQYRLSDSLWQRGYLAGDPVDPSTTAALELFLDRAGLPEE